MANVFPDFKNYLLKNAPSPVLVLMKCRNLASITLLRQATLAVRSTAFNDWRDIDLEFEI